MSVPQPPAISPAAATGDLLDRAEAGPVALRGSILRGGAYVTGILLQLVSVPLIISHLGVSQFGRYITVISLVTIVAGFTEGGLNSVVLREHATLSADRRREIMRSAIGIRTALTLVGVGLAVAFAAVAGYGSTLVLGTVLAGVGLMLQLLQSLLSTTLQSELRFGWASAADLLRQSVSVALLVALVLAGAGLLPLLAVTIPSSAVSLILTVALVRGHISLRPSYHLHRWWLLLKESIPWAAISAVNVIYFRLAIIVMSLVASAIETGYFATSFRIVEGLVALPGLMITAAFPILARSARDDRGRFDYASRRLFELAILTSTWMVVCLEIGAPLAVHVLAGHKAEPAIAVLRIQSPAIIGTFVAMACGFPLLTLRRYRGALITNIVALVVSGCLTLLLARPLGAQGAAIAAVVAETVLALGIAGLLMNASPDVRLPFSAVAVAAIAAGLALAVGLAAPVHPIVGMLVASLVYFGALAALGHFPPEAREVVAGQLSRSFR